MADLNDAVRSANELRSVGQQLTGWDAATWRTATHDRAMRSSIVALSLLDSAPDWQRLRDRFDRLTRLVPALRERPLFGAVGVSMPRMAVDPDFDLDIHLHRFRLPDGGDWNDVLNEARRMSLTDFDLDRPLWEAVLIEGLPDGQAVIVMKMHHAIADGQGAVIIAANLYELTPQGNPDEPPAPPPPRGAPVSVAAVSRANIQDNVGRLLDSAWSGAKVLGGLAIGTLKDPVGTWSDAVDMAESIGRFTSMPDSSLSPLMSGRSATYRFATFQLPFADMKAAAKRRGDTVNDVFLGSVTTGLAAYHDRHGRPTRRLRFNLPISLRKAVKDGSNSNAVTIARFELPVNGASVDERIKAAHDEVKRWREEPALTLANPLADVSWIVPVPVLSSAAKASDITTSNVPGPPLPIYICGARMIGSWPLVPTIGAAANITMVTYNGTVFVGVSVDDAAVADLDVFVADLRGGFDEVIAPPSSRKRAATKSAQAKRPATKRPATAEQRPAAARKASGRAKPRAS